MNLPGEECGLSRIQDYLDHFIRKYVQPNVQWNMFYNKMFPDQKEECWSVGGPSLSEISKLWFVRPSNLI